MTSELYSVVLTQVRQCIRSTGYVHEKISV